MALHYTRIDQLTEPYGRIVLSPHLDDAALSCGGTIAVAAAAGQPVLVVNVCSGSPPPTLALSPFATELHARWGLPGAEAVSLRLREDEAALEILGADCLQLGWLDAIYRLPEAYGSESTLFGAVATGDTLSGEIGSVLGELFGRFPETVFYAPLGVGNHVDHQAVHAAAVVLARAGASVAFYEDFPYVAVEGALAARLTTLGGESRFIAAVAPIDAGLVRKVAAIEAYTSQIGALFGDAAAMALAVSAYAEGLRPDSGTYGERLWVFT